MKIDNSLKNLLSTTRQITHIEENKNDKPDETIDFIPNFAIADLVNTTDEEVMLFDEEPEDLNFISTANANKNIKSATTAGKKENTLRDRLSQLAQIHQEAMNYNVREIETNPQAEIPLEIDDKTSEIQTPENDEGEQSITSPDKGNETDQSSSDNNETVSNDNKTKIEGSTITFANGTTMDYQKSGTLRSFTPKVNDDGSVTFTRTIGTTEEVYVYNENGKKSQHNYERQYGLDEKHSYNDEGKEIYTQRTNEKGVVIFERSSLNGNPKEYSEVQHDYSGNLTISRITDEKEINTCLVNYAAKLVQFKVDGIMISLGAVDGITRDKEFTKNMLDKLVEYAQSLDIKHYPTLDQQNQLKAKVNELLN